MKRFLLLFSAVLLCFTLCAVSASAEHVDSTGWYVQFTGNEMNQNFNSNVLNSIFNSIEPGDDVSVHIKLHNSCGQKTMWYMHNEALQTLEEIRNSAEGGLYTYKLTYTNSAGRTTVLYNSEDVGGENNRLTDPEGLQQISSQLQNYFYLDTFSAGQAGDVQLDIALEGETQGNGYQNTAGSIAIQFAVEPVEKSSITELYSTRPRTADDAKLALWGVIMILSFFSLILTKRAGKLLLTVLAFALLAGVFQAPEAAAEDYVITVYSGNIGTLSGSDVKKIPVNKGETVDLGDIMYGGVTLSNDKYYVRGIRLSGRDNVEEPLDRLTFPATQDAMYCVAYGVKGKLTTLQVRYVDTAGRELLPSVTLYGNVGDKPVVAYKYVDGYQPNANNITGTLKESNNVFTFTYSPIPKPQTTVTTAVTDNNQQNAGNQNAQNNANAQNAEDAENAENTQNVENAENAEQTPEATEAPATPLPVITPAPTPEPAPEIVTIEEPPAPVEMLDLDPTGQETFSIADVAVPLATLQGRADLGDRSARVALVLRRVVFPLLLAVVLGLIILLVILNKRKHRVSLADLRNSEAYSAAPASGPSAAQAYRPAWKDDPNFSDDFYFDRKDL